MAPTLASVRIVVGSTLVGPTASRPPRAAVCS